MQQNKIQMLRMSLQVAQANFQAEVELRQQTEEKLTKIVSEVIAMAYLLLGAGLAQAVSLGGRSLRDMPPVDMIRLVKMQVYEKLSRVQADVEAPPDGIAELESRLQALEEAYEGLEEALARSQRRVGQFEEEERKRRTVAEQMQPGQTQILNKEAQPKRTESLTPLGEWVIGSVPAEVDPGLLAKAERLLRTKPYEDGILRALIEVLGEGIACRRTETIRILENRGFGAASTIERRIGNAIDELGLIDTKQPKAEISGRATHLLRLTGLGLAVAKAILGRNPSRPLLDRLMARHKSPEHTLLNLEAAGLLRAIGGTVNLFPLPVKLPNGSTLDVDLLWRYEGQTRYVECERDTYKNRRQRQDKWHNLYQVTKNFWIVVPNPSAQKKLQSELVNWAVSDGYRFNLHLTNLARATVGNPWLYERRTGLP